jgi:hypothetical protein
MLDPSKSSIRHDRNLHTPGSSPRDLGVARKGLRLSAALDGDQDRLLPSPSAERESIGKQINEAREGDLATPVLGACDPRR